MVFLRLRDSRAEMRFCSRRSRRCLAAVEGDGGGEGGLGGSLLSVGLVMVGVYYLFSLHRAPLTLWGALAMSGQLPIICGN